MYLCLQKERKPERREDGEQLQRFTGVRMQLSIQHFGLPLAFPLLAVRGTATLSRCDSAAGNL